MSLLVGSLSTFMTLVLEALDTIRLRRTGRDGVFIVAE